MTSTTNSNDTTKTITIHVVEFTTRPGARHLEDGKFSGEEYRNDVVLPAFARAVDQDAQLLVDLDGAAGYATSFLEETFGGLVRMLSASPSQEPDEAQRARAEATRSAYKRFHGLSNEAIKARIVIRCSRRPAVARDALADLENALALRTRSNA